METTTKISKWEAAFTKEFSEYTDKRIINAINKSIQYLMKFPDSEYYQAILHLLNKEKEKRNL